jgi:hypothetical protein
VLPRLPARRGPPAHRVPARAKRQDRLHLVEGLLIAILDIDEVIQLIRSSRRSAGGPERLIEVFDLTEAQANYILELQLRRLTKFSRIELETEQDELQRTDRGARGDPRRREAAAPHRLRRTGRGRQGPRHSAAHRAPGVGRHAGRRQRRPRSRWPTTRAGSCSPRPGCSPARRAGSPCPSTARAPSTTRSSAPSAPRPAASSRWSPRPVAWCAFRPSSCRRCRRWEARRASAVVPAGGICRPERGEEPSRSSRSTRRAPGWHSAQRLAWSSG